MASALEPPPPTVTRPPGSVAVLVIALFLSLSVGATGVTLSSLPRAAWGAIQGSTDPVVAREQLILLGIRLPRTILGLFVGAALGVAGTMMQGLFRNPLADPGIVARRASRAGRDRARA